MDILWKSNVFRNEVKIFMAMQSTRLLFTAFIYMKNLQLTYKTISDRKYDISSGLHSIGALKIHSFEVVGTWYSVSKFFL